MKSWLALVLSPSIALGAQSIMYAMVTPSCGTQERLQLHLAAAVALALVLVLAAAAFGESSLRRPEPADSDEAQPAVPRRFLGNLAMGMAALSALVIVAMWLALWVLTPCEP